jgi:hypothetical protein
MPRVELKRIAVKRFSFVLAAIESLLGLIYGILVVASFLPIPDLGVLQLFRFSATAVLPPGVGLFAFLGLEPLIPSFLLWLAVMPAGGFLLGLFQGALLGWLYNFVAGRIGGLVLLMRFSFSEEEQGFLKVSEKKHA